ncbi:MAG TPA: DsbA family protein [Solirubrobacterales bacterium]|nr:DsbA family protein [Solirubrobacterales bacterium]
MTVQVRFYTDPACPWSWAAEPALRRLMWEFEGELEFAWVMGGLARSYERADLLRVVSQWLEDAAAGGMPCDPRIWTQNPLDSTYPACQAVKAAAEQGWEAGYRYLRKLREGIMFERTKLDHADALIAAAGRAGIDRQRFEVDLRSHAITEAFGADLEEVRDPPQEARDADAVHRSSKGRERISLPSALFVSEDGGRSGAWGSASVDPERMRAAALSAGAKQVNEGALEPLDAIGRFGRCASRELEVLAERPGPTVEAELWVLARDWKLRPVSALTGTLWERA